MEILLLIYLIAFLGTTFVARSFLVWRRTGVNPYLLRNTDSAHDYIGAALRVTIALIALSVILNLAPSAVYQWLAPIGWLQTAWAQIIGLAVLTAALVWITVAQAQMGDLWRIGIPVDSMPGALVTNGLFGRSRNPIFLGMSVALIGFFLALPNAVSLLTMAMGIVLMQIQARLEEAYLLQMHGDRYRDYMQRVHRWI